MLPWLALLLLLAPTSGAFAAVSTSHLPTDAAASALVESSGGVFRFATEVLQRDEDDDGKLEVRQRPVRAPGDPAVSRELEKLKNGTAVPFTLTFDGVSRVTLTVTPRHRARTVTNLPVFTVSSDLNELFVRTEARWRGARVTASNLVLNGTAIADSSTAVDNGSGAVDILRIRGGSLAAGFTLTGSLTMSWSHRKHGGHEEERAKLDVQIWGAKVVAADTTPPAVTITAPANGTFVTTARPTITASYSDVGSGVDLASVTVAVDGVNRTVDAQAGPAGLTFTPSEDLPEGPRLVEVTVRDRAGNSAKAAASVAIDTVEPSLSFASPTGTRVIGDPTPSISVVYSDETSGVDLTSFQIALDGIPLNPSCTVTSTAAACEPSPLAEGFHTATAALRDLAGHTVSEVFDFELVLDLLPPSITLSAPEDQSVVNLPQVLVAGTVTDDGHLTSVQVDGIDVAAVGGDFQTSVALTEGPNEIAVIATDARGRQGLATRVVTLDRNPPRLVVETPRPGQLTNQSEVRILGEVTDDTEPASLTIQDLPVAVSAGRFEATASVAPGANLIVVRAVDRAGNEAVLNLSVTRLDLPEVVITSPPDLSFLAATTVDLSGTVSPGEVAVAVNGIPAAVAGTTFVARDVPLIEGGNILTATATDAGGHAGTASINVVRDLSAPRLAIHYPAPGSTVFEPTLTVSGMVNDIVAGTVNASEARVTVNGRPATVANRSFVVEGVPLSPGENPLTVEATDVSGNVGQSSLTVYRAATDLPRIVVEAGDRQEAGIGTALPQPLVVAVLDAVGQPMAGRSVHFKVRGTNGTLDGGRRQLVATSDEAGRASVHLTLGTRAGAGNQVVEASSSGLSGTAVFHSTALPGAPAFLVVDSGDQQAGTAGQQLPRPLVAVVTDLGHNRLEGVAVRFNVVQGRGRFANGLQEIVASSDSDGRAILPFTIDTEEGVANNVVESRIAGLDSGPVAAFVSSGRAAGDPAQTAVSGIVLDNSNQPVAGVTVRILDSPRTTQTDAQGLFRLAGVPVGTIKLIVDGSTAERPGSWPTLEFVVPTVVGQDNTVNMPIFLLPLDQSSGLVVDETHGGILTLPEIPGFGLEVAPGSVTFPSGSRSGVISVTAVHNDKVPMVPNFGQQPRFIVTIQPAGARFDPPARLTLPNVEGLAPGEVTEMYSFDHDLGHFVSIGPATVSEDGALIVADPGVGVIKAGWHCGGNPAVVGTIHACPECKRCQETICVEDAFMEHRSCGTGHCNECIGGRCSERVSDVQILEPKDQPFVLERNFDRNFSFLSNTRIKAVGRVLPNADPDQIRWNVKPYEGDIRDEAPPDRKGQVYEFTPDPPPHPPYVPGLDCNPPGNGSCSRSKPLSYEIRARFCRAYDSIRITQDIVDIIRQEYLYHRLLGIDIEVPARNEFRFPENTANFTASEFLNTAYPVVRGHPEQLAQAVYDEFNRRIHDDIQAIPVGTIGLSPNDVVVRPGDSASEIGPILDTRPCRSATNPATCDDRILGNTIVAGPNGVADTVALNEVTTVGLTINSSWRNPERNEGVGGRRLSRHQFGDAIDLGIVGSMAGKTQTQLWCLLVAAGQAVIPRPRDAFAENGPDEILCNNGSVRVSHVHVER